MWSELIEMWLQNYVGDRFVVFDKDGVRYLHYCFIKDDGEYTISTCNFATMRLTVNVEDWDIKELLHIDLLDLTNPDTNPNDIFEQLEQKIFETTG